ncbi:MAG: phosphate ABC transporter ATP-binding protein [Candidatus Dormibacteraeota bacterium]|nr:phosphate ABC transporter ATP-binding protein [Candidatus Dormibacteraeota bacterium]MBV9526148.1 phosphate ABC transporter ATP-binding protein [Candidatus Dormibacteraeota bacterium]
MSVAGLADVSSELSILGRLRAVDDEPRPRPARDRIVQAEHPAVATRGIDVFYGPFRALRDVSFSAPAGEITAIIGPSGCGKSTLLRTFNRINDLIPGYRIEGEVLLDADDVLGGDIDVVTLRRRVGMLFQKPSPFPMSIYDNVAYGLRLGGRRERTQINDTVERCLRQTALWDEVKDRLHAPGTGLSGGQQQRLCLARTLASGSDVILMDEPCAALDPIATLRIEELLRQLRGEVTIVIVTHNLQQAARVSDYTAFMLMGEDRSGELIEMGRTAELFNDPVDKRTEDYITGRFG